MQILYNGTDITASVQTTNVVMTDYAGGKPDHLQLAFSDAEGLWSKWRPSKNDTVQVKEAGYDSGLMYVDTLGQSAGSFLLGALSLPPSGKTARTQGWENVRLLEIAVQLAARHGLALRTYEIVNHLYERIDQQEEADFTFLTERCRLEGYSLKIHNRSLVIYDEAVRERGIPDPQRGVIRQSEMNGGFTFLDKSTDCYAKCIVRSRTGSGVLTGLAVAPGVSGPTLVCSLPVTSQAEADRYARGILRSSNKQMVTGTFGINLNMEYAAGMTVRVMDTGMFDGVFLIDRLAHDLLHNRTRLFLRQPLEGY